MPDRIKILDRTISEQIAAGEVIERPASVVKELVENSIDALSSRIDIEINDGGRRRIKIADNGTGMSSLDASLAFERHSTSKIRSFEDIYRIKSMGFRGEALSSIASISYVELVTKEPGEEIGRRVIFEGGLKITSEETGCPEGTSITVENIFFNVPARRKFLDTARTEQMAISKALLRTCLAYPEVFFTFKSENKQVFSYPSVSNIIDRICQVYGKNIKENLLEFKREDDEVIIKGFISHPAFIFPNRTRIFTFVNKRFIRSSLIFSAIQEAYKKLIPQGKFPVVILFMDISPEDIDINIHPTKEDIKFSRQSIIFSLVRRAISEGLNSSGVPGISYYQIPKRTIPPPLIEERNIFTPVVLKEEPFSYPVINLKNEFSEILLEDLTQNKVPSKISSEDLTQKEMLLKKPSIETPCVFKDEGDKSAVFSSVIILGNFKNTYIIAKTQDDLLLIDQHVAHERIIFEMLNTNVEISSNRASQSLLLPITMECSSLETEWLRQNLSFLNSLGFDIEDFGDDTFLLRGVPTGLKRLKAENFLRDLLGEFVFSEKRLSYKDMKKELLSSIACKASVRAGEELSFQEMEKLIIRLFNTKDPYYCPHGRPVIIKFSQADLGKLFKRV